MVGRGMSCNEKWHLHNLSNGLHRVSLLSRPVWEKIIAYSVHPDGDCIFVYRLLIQRGCMTKTYMIMGILPQHQHVCSQCNHVCVSIIEVSIPILIVMLWMPCRYIKHLGGIFLRENGHIYSVSIDFSLPVKYPEDIETSELSQNLTTGLVHS